jgi:hypothetical protein
MNESQRLKDLIRPINTIIEQCIPEDLKGDISDGYHTFTELYEFRMIYNAALFNEWAKQGLYSVHKSKRHHDGRKCFDSDDWFVVCAMLPTGQITNHYEMKDWKQFYAVPEKDKVVFEFDGHTAEDVFYRIYKFLMLERQKYTEQQS